MVPATATPSSMRARPAAAGSSVTVTPPILVAGRAGAHAGRPRPHHSGGAPVSTTEHEFCPAATVGERRAATVLAHGRPRRNLFFSVFSEHIGFSIWSLWSVLVLFLPEAVYGIDPAGKFLLTTLPTALGAFVRLPYTFAVAKFGGRNWTIISAALLLVPTIATAIVLEPGVDYKTLLVVSCLAGVGGGNFASSMANINAFYPNRLKGWALGLNAGGGNLGVPVLQLVGLLVLATAGVQHPRLVLVLYIPLIVVAAVGAALLMDNLSTARNQPRAMREATREP